MQPCGDAMKAGQASLVLTNAKVITLDGSSSIGEAMAVDGARIAAVGRAAEVREAAGTDATIIDVGGRAVIPGLIDTHAHMDREGLKNIGPSLAGCRSIDDVLQRIEAAVRDTAPGAWVVTMPVGDPPHYWDGPAGLREGRLPNRRELDRVSPQNPVYIRPIWGYWRHAPNPECVVSVANTLALAETGLSAATVPPSKAIQLETEPDTGELSGVFVERTGIPIVELIMLSHASRFTDEQRREGLVRAMTIYNALGTTGVYEGHGVSNDVFRAYRACDRASAMTVRVRLTHSPSWGAIGDADPGEVVSQWMYWAAGLGNGHLSLNGLYVDPRPGADDRVRAGAAPYTGWAGYHYDCSLPREQLKRALIAAAKNDIQCVATSSDIIELLAEVDREVPLAGRRWIVQHIGMFTPARCELAARLGLIVAPLSIRHIYKEGRAEDAPGIDDFVPLARLTRMGVPVTFASDNAPPSLFHPLWHAVARRDRFGRPVAPACEKLSREQALRVATINGAFLSFEEGERGTIEPGKLADVAVLTDDPLTCDEDRLPDIRSVLTLVDGKIVYRDADALSPGS
jgi:predicted amidohydrolase YtcJ